MQYLMVFILFFICFAGLALGLRRNKKGPRPRCGCGPDRSTCGCQPPKDPN